MMMGMMMVMLMVIVMMVIGHNKYDDHRNDTPHNTDYNAIEHSTTYKCMLTWQVHPVLEQLGHVDQASELMT